MTLRLCQTKVPKIHNDPHNANNFGQKSYFISSWNQWAKVMAQVQPAGTMEIVENHEDHQHLTAWRVTCMKL